MRGFVGFVGSNCRGLGIIRSSARAGPAVVAILKAAARVVAAVFPGRLPNPSRGRPQKAPCYGWGWPPGLGAMNWREGWETLRRGGHFVEKESRRERWNSLLSQNRPSHASRR